jgi:cell division septum initiation protein DivIVA
MEHQSFIQRSAIMANTPNNGIRGNESRTDTIQNAADKARDVARGAVDSARDSATGVMDRARDMAGQVADKARDVAGNVTDKARDWATGAVNAVKDNGVVNKAEEYASEAWETGSRYVHEHSFKDMADDVAGVIRRNPIPALLVGVGLGFVLARSLRS